MQEEYIFFQVKDIQTFSKLVEEVVNDAGEDFEYLELHGSLVERNFKDEDIKVLSLKTTMRFSRSDLQDLKENLSYFLVFTISNAVVPKWVKYGDDCIRNFVYETDKFSIGKF